MLTKDYYSWLQIQSESTVYSKKNLKLIGSQIASSKDKFFYLFFPDSRRTNRTMKNEKYSSNIVERIIRNEEVELFLGDANSSAMLNLEKPKATEEPDWEKMYKNIEGKYNKEYADNVICREK